MSDNVSISRFDFARLATIKQYAELEDEICSVMRAGLGVEHSKANTVFYHISNTRARYAIIGKLLSEFENGIFQKSWSKIEKWLQPCDASRNQIIHWSENTSSTIRISNPGSQQIVEVTSSQLLENPSQSWSGNSPKHFEQDLWNKRDQMRVMLHIVNRFTVTLLYGEQWPWREKFLEPIGDQTPIQFLEHLNSSGHPVQLPPYDQKLLDRQSQALKAPR